MKRIIKKFIKWGLIGAGLCIGFYVVFAVGYFFFMSRFYNNWQPRTSPLEPEVVLDLCVKFQIPEDDPLCILENDVYAKEFNDLMKLNFVIGETSFEDVESRIEDYQTGCREFYKTEYICHYDFNGDGKWILNILFDEEGFVKWVRQEEAGMF